MNTKKLAGLVCGAMMVMSSEKNVAGIGVQQFFHLLRMPGQIAADALHGHFLSGHQPPPDQHFSQRNILAAVFPGVQHMADPAVRQPEPPGTLHLKKVDIHGAAGPGDGRIRKALFGVELTQPENRKENWLNSSEVKPRK